MKYSIVIFTRTSYQWLPNLIKDEKRNLHFDSYCHTAESDGCIKSIFDISGKMTPCSDYSFTPQNQIPVLNRSAASVYRGLGSLSTQQCKRGTPVMRGGSQNETSATSLERESENTKKSHRSRGSSQRRASGLSRRHFVNARGTNYLLLGRRDRIPVSRD